MKTISRNEQIINKKEKDEGIENIDTRVALIQALIPIGLQYVNELLQQEVTVGEKMRRRNKKSPSMEKVLPFMVVALLFILTNNIYILHEMSLDKKKDFRVGETYCKIARNSFPMRTFPVKEPANYQLAAAAVEQSRRLYGAQQLATPADLAGTPRDKPFADSDPSEVF